jgi:hypothetical protein
MKTARMTDERMILVATVVAALTISTACSGSGDGASAEDVSGKARVVWDELGPAPPAFVPELNYTVTNEGSGTANTEVLEPLRPGQLLTVSGDAPNSRIVGGPVLVGDQEFVEVWYTRDIEGFSGSSWERHTEHGLARYGSSDGGAFAEASLLVPTTVKVGMTWELQHSDFEVTSRTEEITPWGMLPVWTIDQHYPHDDSVCSRSYVEGYGLRHDSCALWGPVDGAVELVTEEEFKAPETVILQPLAVGGIAFRMNAAARTMFAIDAAPGEKSMVIATVGESRQNFMEAWTDEDRRCLEVTPDGIAFERSPVPTEDPGADGWDLIWGPPTCPGEFTNYGLFLTRSDRHAAYAWMRPEALGGVWYGRGSEDGRLWGAIGGKNSDNVMAVVGFGQSTPQAFVLNTTMNKQWDAFLDLSGQLAGGTPQMALTPSHAVDGETTTGLVMPSGGMAQVTITETGMEGVPRAGPYVGPFTSVRVTPDMRDVLLASPAGAIDRLTFGDGGWKREPLVNVALPLDDAGIVAAFALEGAADGGGERLLVATRSYPPFTVWNSAGEVEDQFPDPRSYLYIATLPDTPPERPWLGALSVTAEKLGSDMRVCWEASGEPETEGWTIGGAPAGAVLPHFDDKRCVAVFRDPEKALPVDEPGAMIVEGPVPGVGRVRVAMMPGAGGAASFTGGAPLKAGGFISSEALYGPGGIKVKAMDFWYPYAEFYNDIGGHGMWYLHPGGDESGAYLVDETGANYVTNFGYFQVTTQGGGLVMSGVHEEKRWILPDGTEYELPHLNVEAYGVLSNGTQCGSRMTWNMEVSGEQEVSCITLEGELHVLGLGVEEFWLLNENKDWMPMDDTHFLIYNPELDSTRIVDALEFTIGHYEEGQIEGSTFDAQGRLYGQLKGLWYEFTADGPVPLDLSGFEEDTGSINVDKDVYIITVGDGTQRRVFR